MLGLKNNEPAFCMSSIDLAEHSQTKIESPASARHKAGLYFKQQTNLETQQEPDERDVAKVETLRNSAVEIHKKSDLEEVSHESTNKDDQL